MRVATSGRQSVWRPVTWFVVDVRSGGQMGPVCLAASRTVDFGCAWRGYLLAACVHMQQRTWGARALCGALSARFVPVSSLGETPPISCDDGGAALEALMLPPLFVANWQRTAVG